MSNYQYIEVEYLIDIHDNLVIAHSGGYPGIKDKGRLSSVLSHLKNDLYYPTFEEKLSHLVYSIVQFHMFFDGNKRTSIAASVEFLNKNGFHYLTDVYIQEMETIVVWIAEGKISKELLTEFFSIFLSFGELTSEAKWLLTKTLLNP